MATKPVFSQCSTQLCGIDSIQSVSIEAFYNSGDTNLIISGGLVKVNTISTRSIFNWNGSSVSAYNQGVTGMAGLIKGMVQYKNKLYIGGGFNEVDNQPGTANLAIWDGSNWSGCPIGELQGGEVYDMTVYHDTLFICGRFWCIGNTSNIYRDMVATDGTNWFHVGNIGYVWVSSLISYNDKLYLGGYYGMMEYQGGTEWKQLSPGPIGRVNDMDVDTFNNFLYVGGEFSTFGNNVYDGSNYIVSNETTSAGAAYYDGFKWHSMGDNFEWIAVYEQGVKFNHGCAYFGGDIGTFGNGQPSYNIVRWNGTGWDSLGCKPNNVVFALEVFRDTLFIGGGFTSACGEPADGIVKYFSPDTGCHYLQPLVLAVSDTFKINNFHPTVEVSFYNNNAYADSWHWEFVDEGATADTKDATHVFDTPGTYNVSVTVTHEGCTKTATRPITIINNTGIDDYTKESLQFKVYPNPTSGKVSVECTLPQGKSGELRTHHANGSWKNFYRLQSGFNHVDIPDTELSKGVNLLSLFVEGGFVFSDKVIVNR